MSRHLFILHFDFGDDVLKSTGLRNLFKATLCCLYSLVFAELFLRILAPVPVFPRYVTAAPYGVRVNEPNSRYWHTSADVSVQFRTNSKGMRSDEEIPYEPPAGKKRVLVLGDSFAMGYESTLEGMFTSQMADALKSNGFDVQIVNLAVSGHSNAEELIVFREEGKKYHPDVVLLCWHPSDLTENVRSALFELKEEQLVRKNSSYLPGIEVQRRLFQIPGFEWISSRSQIYSWARENLALKVFKPLLLFVQVLRHRSNGNEKATITPGEADPAEDYSKKLVVSLLRQINQEVAEAGSQFLILDIPGVSGGDQLQSQFPQELLTEMHVVNPIPELNAHQGLEIYHKRSHRHFTPAACKIVGEQLAKEIVSHKLFVRPE